MDLFDDFLAYEICFPGAVTGETEVHCPSPVSPESVSPVDQPQKKKDSRRMAESPLVQVDM
jgi:hypothetical protein